ncbi:MAG TPA: putative ABC exporter domain-containing protein [Gemmatimonadaceae bacterium]|nr:putative ABC exporter domain-containing protein [Gemmatimonadaceae bacterium]
MNALLYLSWNSARNRFLSAFRRVRSPRYAVALIVGALYLWGFLWRPANQPMATGFLLSQPSEMLITLLAVLTLAGPWVFGSDNLALAFTQAEVSMLFPAPITRRGLIGHKLFRAQVAVLINAAIWVFVLRRGGNLLPSPLRAVGVWVLFSTLNLHRLGAALVQSSIKAHGRVAAKRNLWSIAAFGFVGAALVTGFVVNRRELLDTDGIGEFFVAMAKVLAQAPASIGLWPFHLVVAPTFARSINQWWHAIIPALAVMGLHVFWVLRSDAAFEDAALEASEQRARRMDAIRSRRSIVVPKSSLAAKTTLRLKAIGHPAMAIFWKNILCLRRTAQLRLLLGPAGMAIAFGAALSSGARDFSLWVTATAATFAGLLIVFGGRLVRNDLRHDMLHLPLLKAVPVRSSDIVLAEVASSTVPIVVLQLVVVVIAYIASFGTERIWLSPTTRLAILVGSPFLMLAINGALITIQNGMAILFPAWIRLGSAVSTGVEALGQNVLAMVANLFTLLVALLPPTVLAALTFQLLGGTHGQRTLFVLWTPMLVAAVILGLETYASILWLGRALTRAEPLQTT